MPAEALIGRRLDALAAVSAAAIQEYVQACAQSANVVLREAEYAYKHALLELDQDNQSVISTLSIFVWDLFEGRSPRDLH